MRFLSLGVSLGISAWMVACSSDAGAPQDPQGGAQDDGGASSDSSSSTDSSSSSSDGAVDSGHDPHDAAPPKAPACHAGDRTEWSGTIPSTTIAVAVCSACGESYVTAANASASAGEVTLDNGTTTITTSVPANGTATSAKLADKADGTVSVCGTSGTHGCLPMAPQNQKYCDPYRSIPNLRAERIDQGVDYGGSGPIYALGPGTIDLYQNRTDTGWPGGTFVSYKLSAGPAAGKTIYLAENIDLNTALHAGSVVYAGTVLGTLLNASPDSESGWGVAGAGYTAEHSCYVEGCTTPLGTNFNQLLVCLNTPAGITNSGGCCPSSAGYPSDWCTLLAAWQ